MNILIQNPAKIDIFTTLFQNMKNFSENINLQFTSEHLYVQTMDNARISILEFYLPNTWFCEYECVESVTLGIHSGILYKILAAREKDQSIRIQYKSDNTDKLFVHMFSTIEKNNSSFERHFETPLMDIEMECVSIPEMDYQVEMSLSSTVFSTIIHQLRGFGDNLEIKCNETVNRWTATTQESGSMSVDMKIDDLHEFAIEEGCDLSLEFALQYLANIGSYSKICKNVHLKMHADFPLRLDYPLDTENNANIKYYLAPKISEE